MSCNPFRPGTLNVIDAAAVTVQRGDVIDAYLFKLEDGTSVVVRIPTSPVALDAHEPEPDVDDPRGFFYDDAAVA